LRKVRGLFWLDVELLAFQEGLAGQVSLLIKKVLYTVLMCDDLFIILL